MTEEEPHADREDGGGSPAPCSGPVKKRKRVLRMSGLILLFLWILPALVNRQNVNLATGVFLDVFSTGCLVASIACFIAAFLVKPGK